MRQFEAVQLAFESVGMTTTLWNTKHVGGLKNTYSDNTSKRYAIIYALKWELRLTNESLSHILSVSQFTITKALSIVVSEMSLCDKKRCNEITGYINKIENSFKQFKEQ